MGAKSDTLATRFEAKAREAAAVLETVSDADWKKVTEAEKWPVGVTAHHLAGAFERVAAIATALASGQSRGDFTTRMLEEMNAQHAREHAGCTRAETLALHRKSAAAAAAMVRALSDEQLAKSVAVFTDVPPMTVEQFLTRALLGHIDEHVGSIRKTAGA